MRLLLLLLVALLFGLQYAYWWGKGGRGELRELQQQIAQQQDEIQRLQERNATLTAEVADLKQGLEAIEELARSEMGMIKADEEFFQVVEPRPDGSPSGVRPREQRP